ncbi:MAG: hypothetical protein DMF62_10625 [Acidobacteria bacterium]|nr:MAG: hypothetical protein DMF62_10625 [Acidobacteriota bacterium]
MKKAISSLIVIILLSVPNLSVFGQKTSLAKRVKSALEAKAAEASRSKAANVFESVKASMSRDRVLIEWQMRSEVANIGFYVHRVDTAGDQIINSEIVFGSAATTGRQPQAGTDYKFLDYFGGINSSYYIESVDLDGNRVESGIAKTLATRGKGNVAGVPSNSAEPNDAEGLSLRSEKLALTKEILLQRSEESVNPDPATHAWVISHPGARIDIKTEGIYRVPFAQLQSAGFDINSDKSLWQLYRAGLEQAFSINETGNYIEFYGKGIDTPETDIQGYFLIVGETAGKRIQNSVARPSNSTVALANYNQTFTFKERTNYLNTILNGNPENYWGRTVNATGSNINFDLNGIDFNSPTTTLTLKAQGFSSGSHNLRITLNGQLLDPATGISQFPFSVQQVIPTSLLKDVGLGQGTNVMNLASTGPSGDFNLFDSFSLSFARKHTARQGVLSAYTVNNKKTVISGFASANVTLYDITRENDPIRITNLNFQDQGGGSFGMELGAARGRVLYGVDDAQIMAPFAVVNNDGQVLSSTQLGADLIIIAYKDFMTQAQTWANYRISQGLSVKVVNVDEIYNEFNYGSLSSDSIESFLNYAYHNWNHAPQYVLLLGDSSYDSRNYQGVGFFNYVPTRIVTTVFTETGSDDSLVDFNHDGLIEMAIGRIPARQSSAIDIAFQKTVNWEGNLTDPLSRGALMVADIFDGTNLIDFPAISDRIAGELPPSMPKTTVLRSQPNAPADLLTQLNAGKYITNYTGHGAAGTWSNTGFFWNGTVVQLNNHNSESLFTMLTCLNGYFLSLNGISLAETLLAYDNGGAVAVWASSGETTPDVQEVMGRRFFRKIGEGSIPRLGDLVKDAKSIIPGGADVRLSFVLLGDPMLKVR